MEIGLGQPIAESDQLLIWILIANEKKLVWGRPEQNLIDFH